MKYKFILVCMFSLILGVSWGNGSWADEVDEESITASEYKVQEGLQAYIKEDYESAAEHFKKALLLEPWNKKAKQYLEELGLSDFVKKVESGRVVTKKYNAIKDLRKLEEKIKAMEIQMAQATEKLKQLEAKRIEQEAKMKELEAKRIEQEAKMKELEAKKAEQTKKMKEPEVKINKIHKEQPKEEILEEWLRKKIEELEKDD